MMKIPMTALACVTCLSFAGRATAQVYELDFNRDAYEPNDSRSEAHYLRTHKQWIPGLSIYPVQDIDWFYWSPVSTGTLLVVAYENGNGPLLVVLLNKAGTRVLAFSSGTGAKQVLSYNVTSANNTYAIAVLSGNRGTNLNYALLIDGSATDGRWNLAPTAPDFNLQVVESEPEPVDLFHHGARDANGDHLTIKEHASPLGHVVPSAFPKLDYWPGSSILASHDFSYVLDDGEGGRAKGLVNVTVQPRPDDLAFVGAKGFGAMTPGGRGRDIYTVTRLEDDFSVGSLRWALRQAALTGGGIIVFEVGGPIVLNENIGPLKIESRVTIAGETAPNPGITVFNRETRIEDGVDVIVRYMRFRNGNKNAAPDDALTVINAENVIIDHCSLSWGNDGTIDIWNTDKVTLQWSIISETLLNHSAATLVRNKGTLLPGFVTFHHNLWAHNRTRSPWVQDNVNADVINNVIYNWGPAGSGGWATYIGSANDAFPAPGGTPGEPFIGWARANVSRNYYITGPNGTPNTHTGTFYARTPRQATVPNEFYVGRDPRIPRVTDNYGDLDADSIHDGRPLWVADYAPDNQRLIEHDRPIPWNIDHIPLQEQGEEPESAEAAYEAVFSEATGSGVGASLYRDAIDKRVIGDVQTRFKKHGHITQPRPWELP